MKPVLSLVSKTDIDYYRNNDTGSIIVKSPNTFISIWSKASAEIALDIDYILDKGYVLLLSLTKDFSNKELWVTQDMILGDAEQHQLILKVKNDSSSPIEINPNVPIVELIVIQHST